MQSGVEREARTGLFFPGDTKEDDEMAPSASAERNLERVKAQLKARLGGEVYSSWFERMMLAEASKGVVRISVPTAFLKSWINGHYLDLIAELWRQEEPALIKIEIVVRSATRGQRPRRYRRRERRASRPARRRLHLPRAPCPAAAPNRRRSRGRGLPHRISGRACWGRRSIPATRSSPSSRARPTGWRWRRQRRSPNRMSRFNPLFLHATVGLGKTHLLQAIAAESLKQNAKARVVYLTAEYFMWRFATAIRDNNALTLKEQLRDIDLLIIDDMQFLQGKSIQHEFCHLINMLLDSARQVVVAADRPPAELESLEPRVDRG